MRYILVEPKDSHSTRLKALLVVAETPQEALSYVPQESQDTYRVTGQSGKGIDRPTGLVTAFHHYKPTSSREDV